MCSLTRWEEAFHNVCVHPIVTAYTLNILQFHCRWHLNKTGQGERQRIKMFSSCSWGAATPPQFCNPPILTMPARSLGPGPLLFWSLISPEGHGSWVPWQHLSVSFQPCCVPSPRSVPQGAASFLKVTLHSLFGLEVHFHQKNNSPALHLSVQNVTSFSPGARSSRSARCESRSTFSPSERRQVGSAVGLACRACLPWPGVGSANR